MTSLKNTVSLPSVISPDGGLMLDQDMVKLITLGRAEADDKATADLSRNALVSALIEAGYTHANTAAYTPSAVKDGTVSNENKAKRDGLTFLSLASISITINGEKVRLSDENLAKAMDDTISGRAMLQGMPKGTINGERTWRGDATSHLGRLRAALQAAQGGNGKGAGGVTKTDKDKAADALQKALNILSKDVEKGDGTISVDLGSKMAAWLRDGAASFGIKLSMPGGKK